MLQHFFLLSVKKFSPTYLADLPAGPNTPFECKKNEKLLGTYYFFHLVWR